MRNTAIDILKIFLIIFVLPIQLGWGAEKANIAWGSEYQGLSLGISLDGNEDTPLKIANIYLWAMISENKNPPKIDPYSIRLMNYTPKDITVRNTKTYTDQWGSFHWERVSSVIFKSKLLKVSSRPSGRWGIEATIPVDWNGRKLELKTGRLNYTIK